MISKQKALYLLEDAFDVGRPTMVHGTSVEAVIELFKSEKLPSSFYRGDTPHPADQGYLFFVPRKKSFVSHALYNKIKIDLDGGKLEDEVSSYAAEVQGRRFLFDTLGNWSSHCNTNEFEPYGNYTLEELKEDGVDIKLMKRYGLQKLMAELKKRKGVCVGINEKIFELEIQNGCDEPGEEVMICLPEGLDIRYVHYIYPLGELEEKALRDFISELPESSY